MSGPPPFWHELKPRFMAMVDDLGPVETARRIYGDTGSMGVQMGLRSVLNWKGGTCMPQTINRVHINRVVLSYEKTVQVGTSRSASGNGRVK